MFSFSFKSLRVSMALLAGMTAFSGAATTASQALECRFCEGKDLGELVQLSVDMESASLRAQIRGWLGEKHPETGPGYFGRAWIASSNGASTDEVVGLYREAIRLDPSLSTAYVNGGFALAGAGRIDEALELYREGMAQRPDDPIFVRNIYFTLLNDLKDQRRAEAFLSEAESNQYTVPWGYDYIRGIGAQSKRDRATADRFYTSALENGGTYEVLDRWLTNRLALQAEQRADRDARVQTLVEALQWGRSNQSAAALFDVAKILSDDYQDYTNAYTIFRESFETRATPEAATSAFGSIGNSDFYAGLGMLEQAEALFPYNHEVLQTLVWAHTNFLLDEDKARDYGPRAIANSPRNDDLYESLRQYVTFLEEVGDHTTPAELFETYLSQTSGRANNNILGDYIDNRIRAGALDHAGRLLEQARTREGFSTKWVAVRENRISGALRLANQRDRYFAENPFLVKWEERFGDSLRVSVEFETGKADIRPESFAPLQTAADLLKSSGSEDYVFLIEGHTDSVGTDAVNLPLSQARAASVKTFFVDQQQIDPARLQTIGYGPRIPLATNETDTGKQTNRRVEIRPFGNISAPRIATNGWIDANRLRLSRDGRIAVMGNSPIQVWDLERRVRLHQLPIGSVTNEISPNGRYLAAKSAFEDRTGTTTNMMYIYDLRTGLVHSQLPVSDFVDEISWSPFSDAVAWSERGGFLRVYDIKSKSYRGVTKIALIRGSEELLWLASGDQIAAKAPQGAPLRIFDANTLQVLKEIPNPGWLHDLTQTSDGRHMVAITNNYELVVWDTGTWQEVRRQRMPIAGFNLAAHPTRPWIMISDGFENETRLALVDVTTGEIVSSRRDSQSIVGSFTPDGNSFVAAVNDEIVYYDTGSLQETNRISGQSVIGRDITVVKEADLLISRDANGSSVWSLKTGRRVHRIERPTVSGWRPLSRDGTVLVSANDEGQIITFDTRSYVDTVAIETGLNLSKANHSENYFVVAAVPEGDGPFSSPRSEIIVYEREGLREVLRTSFDIVSEPVRYGDIYDPRVYLDIADNGLLAVTSAWVDGYKKGSTFGQIVTIYDAKSGSEVRTFRADGRFSRLKWEKGGEEFWFADKSQWYVHDPRTAEVLRTETPKATNDIALSDGRTLHWFWDHVSLDGKEVVFPYTLRDVEVHEARNLAMGHTTGNEIVFIDLKNMVHVLTIAQKADGEWIAYAPDGGYSASLNGTEGVFWSLGDNYVPFSALSDRYKRPELIQNLLEAVARGDSLPDTGPDVEADVFEAPYTLTLVSQPAFTTTDETFTLELSVEKTSVDLPDPEIEYTLNGRRVLKSRGFEEDAFFDGNETLGITRRFSLKPGENVIEASLVWRDARIQTQTVEVLRDSGTQPEQRVAGQTLWFFGVGVSDYEKSSQNLNFAHRDAEELSRLLKAQEGGLFDTVNTRIILNSEATERNVRVQMNEFLDQAAPEDTIVLFLAGHGVTDEEQELYFITHEADLKKPYTGMSVDRFRNYLENRPLNQNALLLLDICHSGAAEGRVVADDAVQNLTEGTGAVVFASSSGSEQSFEDESFGGGHGAFTAALLEGLRGLADNKAGNQDGLISLRETVLFTSTRVPEMTGGQQRPTIPPLALSVDYPLSRAAN
ncbi:OmpA family protein [Hoeflea sp.]|uniref:OmpA family protein n=1 Tax=Hoeflea sp. TaxID=1940281 RepID=UPI003BAFC433